MRRQRGWTIVGLLMVMLVLVVVVGYVWNVVHFVSCDFKEPYKCEVIRGAGVVVPPLGVVLGYVPIDD